MKIHANQYLKQTNQKKIKKTNHKTKTTQPPTVHNWLKLPPNPILSFSFLIKWLKNTEALKVFWQAKLSLLTQVAWSRVTDDADRTDGVADILHSYSSMKTLNWRLIVPKWGEKSSTCFYSNLWGQEASGRAQWSLEETNRAGGGVRVFSGCWDWEAMQIQEDDLHGATFHSLSFCLVILLSAEGKIKSYCKADITPKILLVHTPRTRH